MWTQLVLAVVVALADAQTCPNDNDDCAFPEGCLTNIRPNNSGFNVSNSPYYDVAFDSGYSHDEIDSSCWTYFQLGYKLYQVYTKIHYVTFKNGTSQVRTYLAAQIDNARGIYRSTGIFENTTYGCDTCTFNDYYLAQPSPDVFVLNRCNIFGRCKQDFGKQNVYNAISSSPNISDAAYNAILAYNFTNPIRVPYCNSAKCVVSINNTYAVNYERVPCENRVHLVSD